MICCILVLSTLSSENNLKIIGVLGIISSKVNQDGRLLCISVLTDAMAKRELKPLESAIDKTVKCGLEEKMSVQLQMAGNIVESLKVLEF